MATPNLALFPSGRKATKLYSVLPTDGTGDFTFSRASAATEVNSEGLIEEVLSNVPRLNYDLIDGVVQSCPSLLLEPQRSNLITYSEDLSGSNWLDSGILSTDKNSIISPDGTLNGSKVIESTGNTEHRKRQSFSVVANTQYTYTGYFKPLGNRNLCILTRNTGFSSGYKVVFDFESQSIYNQSAIGTGQLIDASIELQNNGWYKVSLTTIVDNTSTSAQIEIFIIKENSAITTYLGDGVSGLYIWGVQVEQGSYATSYIPTSGSAVTRSVDSTLGQLTSGLFNSLEGTLFLHFKAFKNDTSYRYIAISDGTVSNRVVITLDDTYRIQCAVSVGGATQSNVITTMTNDSLSAGFKVAMTYKNNEFRTFVNGVETTPSDTSGSVFPIGTLKYLRFTQGNTTSGPLNGETKSLQYYNTVLTEAECITLTTL